MQKRIKMINTVNPKNRIINTIMEKQKHHM